MTRLAGKTAVVLGAAGRGNMAQVIAERFVEEGARVIVAGRHAEELERFAAEIGAGWTTYDITSKAECDALAAFADDVQIAVNATGWGLLKPFLETKRLSDSERAMLMGGACAKAYGWSPSKG